MQENQNLSASVDLMGHNGDQLSLTNNKIQLSSNNQLVTEQSVNNKTQLCLEELFFDLHINQYSPRLI